MTLTEFLLKRIANDEETARDAYYEGQRWAPEEEAVVALDRDLEPVMHFDRKRDAWFAAGWSPARVLAECKAKRQIVEQHKAWPVLVEQPPTFDQIGGEGDINSVTFRAGQQIAWLTEQEYRARFGSEPPTAPMIRTLAAIYADHPDYREEWKPRAGSSRLQLRA